LAIERQSLRAKGCRGLHWQSPKGNVILLQMRLAGASRPFAMDSMPTHVHAPPHHHHHPAGRGHPPAAVSPSILRMGLIERLAAVAVVIALIWGAVFWAIS
jgi:hypothetical protein